MKMLQNNKKMRWSLRPGDSQTCFVFLPRISLNSYKCATLWQRSSLTRTNLQGLQQLTGANLLGQIYWDKHTGTNLLGQTYWDKFTGTNLPGQTCKYKPSRFTNCQEKLTTSYLMGQTCKDKLSRTYLPEPIYRDEPSCSLLPVT